MQCRRVFIFDLRSRFIRLLMPLYEASLQLACSQQNLTWSKLEVSCNRGFRERASLPRIVRYLYNAITLLSICAPPAQLITSVFISHQTKALVAMRTEMIVSMKTYIFTALCSLALVSPAVAQSYGQQNSSPSYAPLAPLPKPSWRQHLGNGLRRVMQSFGSATMPAYGRQNAYSMAGLTTALPNQYGYTINSPGSLPTTVIPNPMGYTINTPGRLPTTVLSNPMGYTINTPGCLPTTAIANPMGYTINTPGRLPTTVIDNPMGFTINTPGRLPTTAIANPMGYTINTPGRLPTTIINNPMGFTQMGPGFP